MNSELSVDTIRLVAFVAMNLAGLASTLIIRMPARWEYLRVSQIVFLATFLLVASVTMMVHHSTQNGAAIIGLATLALMVVGAVIDLRGAEYQALIITPPNAVSATDCLAGKH